MPDPTEEEKAAAAEKEAAEKAAAEAKAAEEKAAEDAKSKGLTPEDRAALEAVVAKERAATKAAEKAARDAQAKLDAAEKEKLSETEKLQKEAEDGKALAATATEKLRKANLITALADQGLTGSKAKAAARLLDDVQYGDDDEPTNLDDALKAAKAEYGDDVFKGVKAPASKINGGEGSNDDEKPVLTADELAMAKSFDMTPAEYEQAKNPQQPLLEAAK